MKLTYNMQMGVLAVLVVALAFNLVPGIVKQLLHSPVGKLVWLALVVYLWMTKNKLVAVLVLAVYLMHCPRGSVWEGVDETLEKDTKKEDKKDKKEQEIDPKMAEAVTKALQMEQAKFTGKSTVEGFSLGSAAPFDAPTA